MRIIAIMNQKGGVGKTTTAINLGAALAELGQRVLLIDLDPQANLTSGLGLHAETLDDSVYRPLTDPDAKLEEIVQQTAWENLSVAPSHIDLSGAEIEIAPMEGREIRLLQAMGDLHDRYDFILIDCLPSLSLLTINALTTAGEIFIPMQAHPFALDGLTKLFEIYELVHGHMNENLAVTGVLITMFDTRTNVSREVVEKLRADDRTKDKIFDVMVRMNIKIAESQREAKPVIHHDPACHGARAYRAFGAAVLEMDVPPWRHPLADATDDNANTSTEEAVGETSEGENTQEADAAE